MVEVTLRKQDGGVVWTEVRRLERRIEHGGRTFQQDDEDPFTYREVADAPTAG